VSDLAAKIKSHGYWRVLIRPEGHVKDRIASVTDLFPLIQRLAVQLRGWDFPHVDIQNRPHIGDHWAGQDFEWEHHLERWRLYQSGQFGYLGAFTLDWATHTDNWLPRPPKAPQDALLGISDVVCRFAEIFEFASALALSPAGDDPMFLSVGCHGIQDRELWLDDPNRVPFSRTPKCSVPEFVQSNTFPRETLVAETSALGNLWAKELFRRFDWDPSDSNLVTLRALFR
jgi:hypothetical protein